MKNNISENIFHIRPRKGWQAINFSELYRYRDLLWFLSLRGIKARYAQSILGVSWAVIQPLFSTLIFTVVFGNIARIESDGVPYFLFSIVALVPWNYFSGTLTDASSSLIANATMLSKVYFPRLILPLSSVISKLLDFIIGMIMIMALVLIYQIVPSWEIVFLPLLVFILLINSLGLGMILSAMGVQYRDVRHALTFVIQLMMYLAPVVYPTSNVPEQFRTIYSLNPMVGVVEGFRSIFLHTIDFPWPWVLTGLAISIPVFCFGLAYFNRMEKNFADVA